ncbi:hypothetical protein [Candidatus Electronema sp. PJ]|uniref:hypothetical protein n=1 Tax=Candidatus Electronema sp. PJ TaxID=3401572 RepID=UPI003AA996DA
MKPLPSCCAAAIFFALSCRTVNSNHILARKTRPCIGVQLTCTIEFSTLLLILPRDFLIDKIVTAAYTG